MGNNIIFEVTPEEFEVLLDVVIHEGGYILKQFEEDASTDEKDEIITKMSLLMQLQFRLKNLDINSDFNKTYKALTGNYKI